MRSAASVPYRALSKGLNERRACTLVAAKRGIPLGRHVQLQPEMCDPCEQHLFADSQFCCTVNKFRSVAGRELPKELLCATRERDRRSPNLANFLCRHVSRWRLPNVKILFVGERFDVHPRGSRRAMNRRTQVRQSNAVHFGKRNFERRSGLHTLQLF